MLTMLAVTFLLATKNPSAVQAERLVKEGDRLLESERFEQALLVYREAIQLDPTMMLAHYGAGQAQMALKEYPAAITSFKDARVAFEARAAQNQDQRFEHERAREDRIQALRDRIRQNQERAVEAGSPEAAELARRLAEVELGR